MLIKDVGDIYVSLKFFDGHASVNALGQNAIGPRAGRRTDTVRLGHKN